MQLPIFRTSTVLIAISAKIREILRLMTADNGNKDLCLTKLDSCISHLNGIGGVVDADRIATIEDNLLALRTELLREDQDAGQATTASSDTDEIYYSAPRPLSGKFSSTLVYLGGVHKVRHANFGHFLPPLPHVTLLHGKITGFNMHCHKILTMPPRSVTYFMDGVLVATAAFMIVKCGHI